MSKKLMTTRKSSADYMAEMHTLLDEIGAVIERAKARGFRPSFVAKYGALMSVATSPCTAADALKVGRPAKPSDAEEEVGEMIF